MSQLVCFEDGHAWLAGNEFCQCGGVRFPSATALLNAIFGNSLNPPSRGAGVFFDDMTQSGSHTSTTQNETERR